MYGNEDKRIIEKNINGIVYYTYWGGNEVCTMWRDVKDRMMEQCFYVGEKNKLEFGFSLIEMIVCLFLLSIFFALSPPTFH